MVNYTCATCGKEFQQKSHYESHKNRKNPCQNNTIFENLVNKVVDEKLKQLNIIPKANITEILVTEENKINEDKNILKYIDLFCGLGAFHTAFNKNSTEKMKYQCVLASDIDEGVRKIYEENYKLKPEGDINKIDIKNIPDFDILCAGFPCQPFSIAGKKEGFEDKVKGNLFYKILEIVDIKKPKVLFLENVKNLQSIHNGNTFEIIKNEIIKRGYTFSFKVIDSKYYNCPQSRQRIFMICSKYKEYKFKEVKNKIRPVSTIIDKSNKVFFEYKDKYKLEECNGKNTMMQYKLINKITGKGGRQGERVYSTNSYGPTICASSGGPGAKTGLYKIGNKIRTLSVLETLQMFGFNKEYKYNSLKNKDKMLFYLGNSIVVDVVNELIKELPTIF
jgi:DNA (cytosine-5)-methyltransferase 1